MDNSCFFFFSFVPWTLLRLQLGFCITGPLPAWKYNPKVK